MEEQASFETQAVLAPKSARRTRLVVLVPAIALVATAWAGLSGEHSSPSSAQLPPEAEVAAPSAIPAATTAPTAVVRLPHPDQIFGLAVQPLDAVDAQPTRPGDLVVLSGWYVTTAITDCPPIAAIYRDGALPYVRGDADALAFCVRSGVLYASAPEPFDGRNTTPGLPAVAATLAVGIVVPREIEVIDAAATEVVVIGRFVDRSSECLPSRTACPPKLVVDHVAWTSGV